MGDMYDLINTAKSKFSSKVILSGVLRRDVSWRRIGAVNDKTRVGRKHARRTFVNPNSWVDDWGYSGDGLHLNRRGAQQLGKLT